MYKHYSAYCEQCETEVIICGQCGNNTCNGGVGEVNGEKCSACEEAYSIFMSGLTQFRQGKE